MYINTHLCAQIQKPEMHTQQNKLYTILNMKHTFLLWLYLRKIS